MPIEKENFILNLINSETGEELCCIDNLEDNLLSVESKSYSFDKERKALNSFHRPFCTYLVDRCLYWCNEFNIADGT